MNPPAENDGRFSRGSELDDFNRGLSPQPAPHGNPPHARLQHLTDAPGNRIGHRAPRKPMILCLLIALAVCSQDGIPTSVAGPEQNRLVAHVLVRPSEAILAPDETLQMSTIVKGARGQTVNGRPVTWSSSDESVAYVDAEGNIVAGNEGSATITANVQGVRGRATIDVRGDVVDILINNPLTNLAEGDVERLTATYVFSNGATRAAGYLRWRTSDPRILSIDGDGDATARNAGDVTVTAEGRGVSAAKGGNVGKGKVASVTVYASATQIEVGEQSLVWAEILNDKGQKMSRKPQLSSSDPSIVSVDAAGNIQGNSVGTATITASAGGKSGSIDIQVASPGTPPPPSPDQVTDLSVADAGETSITLRFTEVDDGTGVPADYEVRYAEGTSFDWDDGLDVTKGSCASPVQGESVAATRDCTVDGLGADTNYAFQLVAFRTDDGERVYGPLSNQTTGRADEPGLIVDVLPSSLLIDVGTRKPLTARVTDTYGNPVDHRVTWSSSQPHLLRVSASGVVTALRQGPQEAFVYATAERPSTSSSTPSVSSFTSYRATVGVATVHLGTIPPTVWIVAFLAGWPWLTAALSVLLVLDVLVLLKNKWHISERERHATRRYKHISDATEEQLSQSKRTLLLARQLARASMIRRRPSASTGSADEDDCQAS